MLLVGAFLFLTSVVVDRVYTQTGCNEVMNCDNYDILNQDSSVGLISRNEVDPLCRVIGQLNKCIERNSHDCSYSQRVSWEPALQAALVICNNTEVYKRGTDCYFNDFVLDSIDMCYEAIEDSGMVCSVLTDIPNCISSDLTGFDQCKGDEVTLLVNIATSSLNLHLKEFNCIKSEPATSAAMTTTTVSTTTTAITTQPILDETISPRTGQSADNASSLNIINSILIISTTFLAIFNTFILAL